MQRTFPHLFQQQTYIQYLMMIITIVKYSEYIYVILVTQIKGIQFFFKFELLFPDLWHFQILRKRQFSSKQHFKKSPLHKMYKSQNNLKHLF